MANLVYYRNEKIEFEEAYKKKMSVEEAKIVYKKLLKHFKLSPVRLEWTSGRIRPKCCSWRVLLNVSWNTFGVICHEVAHLYQFQYPKHKGNGTWHNKKHKKLMARMIRYCEKKNYWNEEFKRRLAPKPIKPQPTKEELTLKLITRLESNCKRYQTKLKLYGNKLKKVEKKIARAKRFI